MQRQAIAGLWRGGSIRQDWVPSESQTHPEFTQPWLFLTWVRLLRLNKYQFNKDQLLNELANVLLFLPTAMT